MAKNRITPKGQIRNTLTAEYARECLDYNPETGLAVWKTRPREHFFSVGSWKSWNGRFAGKSPRNINSFGYLRISINNTSYRLHLLIWLMMTGAWSLLEVDHKDLNPINNRWDNLREATHAQNNQNKPMRPDNTSGYKGVTFDKSRNKWAAVIRNNGVQHHLGRFDTAQEAGAAYQRAAREHHGEFARIA